MKRNRKEKRHFKDDYNEERENFRNSKEFKLGQKHLIMVFFNTVIAVGLYFYFNSIEFWPGLLIYGVVFAVLTIAYVVYNRGFSRDGVTREMLPDTMSEEEKSEFFTDRDRRKKKSKWMLTVIIPLIFTLMLDTIVLFVIPYFQGLFS